MPTTQIPLVAPSNRNVDPMELSQHSARIVDGYIDELNFINRRPGFDLFKDVGNNSSVEGLYWWDEDEKLVSVVGRHAYTTAEDGTTVDLGSGMNLTVRPTFAVSKPAGVDTLAMANGGKIFTTTGTTITAISDADAPTAVTHIVFFDSYLIANNIGSGTFYYSNVNDPHTWSALDFASAEGRPDDITAIHVLGRELYLFGPRSIEVWYNDGVTPFRPISGRASRRGVSAPYSIVDVEDSFLFLDENRNVVRLSGGSEQVVSGAVNKLIYDMGDVSDAYADKIYIAGRYFYVITFPSATRNDGSGAVGVTLVYDYALQQWYEWAEWDTTVPEYKPFRARSHAFSLTWGRNFIGDSDPTGEIFELKKDEYQDDGSNIRTMVRTGYIDHGTSLRKCCNNIRLRMKRGDAAVDPTYMTIKYRDQGNEGFGNEVSRDIGGAGDTDFCVDYHRMGQYRARQYEIVNAENTPFILGNAEENFDVMTS